MSTQKSVFFSCTVLAALLGLMGCAAPIAVGSPEAARTFTAAPGPRLTASPGHTPSSLPAMPTLVPTLPATDEQQMKELLQAEDCKLPCYLGITPGKTSLRDARAILEGLGGNSLGEYKRTIDFGIEYPYVFVIAGQPGADSVTRADGSIVGIYDHISLITNNDIVQIIEMSASTAGPGVSATQALAKLREYWSRYTAREVFLQAGIPDHIYISKPDPYAIGSSLLIAYRKLGVVAKIAGTATENNICPTREAKSIVIELSLFAPTTLLRTIYDDGRVPPTDREVWLPVEGALGVSAYEFYTEAVANPGACFAPR